MITKHIAEVTTKFNPFKITGRTCRLFLAELPADARQNMKINAKVLSRDSLEKSELKVKFKDGKDIDLDPETLVNKDIITQIDRHSRILNRQAELTAS
ncbi:uncharacterized protein KY384_008347 [Bacidia gigantensis]|uniref:uncharacterized protein n=1 Tax=Bacidia gigantensis TaxID=2732470 RepID=UPI001D04239A|nr:uncharacterized protein KY384_008347 [Bacidia gigantensis]KAG8526918.1 hypothetical protein KY384_008347 [Bacidia gigantensis]